MNKPHLLLLHGALGAAKQFDKLKEILADSFTVHVLDFSGHGQKSSQNNGFGIDEFAGDAEDYLDENGLDSVNIFGYSMGGYVALWLAHKRPQRVEKIFTLATKFNWSPEAAAGELKKLNPDKILEKVPQFAQYQKGLHGQHWQNVMRNTAEMMAVLGENPLVTDDVLKNLKVPVRVAVGDGDNMVTIEETEHAFKLLEQGQLQVFPATPHPFEKVVLPVLCFAIQGFLGEKNIK